MNCEKEDMFLQKEIQSKSSHEYRW